MLKWMVYVLLGGLLWYQTISDVLINHNKWNFINIISPIIGTMCIIVGIASMIKEKKIKDNIKK